jgi:hypothetical protein
MVCVRELSVDQNAARSIAADTPSLNAPFASNFDTAAKPQAPTMISPFERTFTLSV